MLYDGEALNQAGRRGQTDLRAPTQSQTRQQANTYAQQSGNYAGLSANTYGAERGGYGQESGLDYDRSGLHLDYDRSGLQSGLQRHDGSAYGERGGSYNSPSRGGSRSGSPGRRGAAAYGQQGLYGRDEYADDYSLSRDREPAYGGGYGQSQAMYAMAPLAVSKELFVNVLVTAIDEESTIKSVQSWMGGMLKGNQHKGEMKAMEVSPVISDMVKRVIYGHGWDSDISLMMLPPSHGVQRWAPYLQMGVDHLPILMVFRVQLRSRVRHRQDVGGLSDLSHMFGSCCDMFVPGSAIRREDWEHIGRGISDSLRRLRNQIRASVEVRDAPGEFHVLHTKGWTEELASQAIMQSRGSAGHDGYGSSYGQQGMGMGGIGGMGGMGMSQQGQYGGGYSGSGSYSPSHGGAGYH